MVQANNEATDQFSMLEQGVRAALETYSNVHRGSGYNSLVSTHLFEGARKIVLDYLGLRKDKYVVIFCTPQGAATLESQLHPGSFQCLSSRDIGLPAGVRALAVDRKKLPHGTPFQTGGGTTKLVSRNWIIWADIPDRFEAGTPAIINVIAFARALKLIRYSENNAFRDTATLKLSADEILYHDELETFSGQRLFDELRKTLIGRNILVPTFEGTRPYINLDNAASTPTFDPVWEAVRHTWHQSVQVHQEIIHKVRSICAEALGAPPGKYDVIFTSNTTEAINIVTGSLKNETVQDIEPVVLNTLLEHNSNDLPWRRIPNYSLIRMQVDSEGFLDLNELDNLLMDYNQNGRYGRKRIRIIAISGASNVLGTCNNLAEISRIVHKYGAQLLVDAAQLIAHRKVNMEQYGIDYLAFSAHKVYAPFGTGVLVVRKGLLNFSPAGLELINSSGEENAGGIAALGKALLLLQRIGMDLIRQKEQALTGKLLLGLSQIKGIKVHGIKDPGSPGFADKSGVIVFEMKGIMPNTLAKTLAGYGIGIRYGCHCSHLLIKHLLKIPPQLEWIQGLMLMLFPKIRLPGIVRVSIGIGNSENDIDTLIRILDRIANQKGSTKNQDLSKQLNDFINAADQRVYHY